MSSTNRSSVRSPNDYYVTPVNQIVDFLCAFRQDTKISFRNNSFLDPCAGGDGDHSMSYPAALRMMIGDEPIDIETIDIREDSDARDKRDYLDPATPVKPVDIIISNPPFSLAQEFINKALKDVKSGGYVIFLLRLTYFGSKDRRDWWRENMPSFGYIHSKRMSFKTPLSEKLAAKPFKRGQSDSVEYAHLVWIQGQNPKWTQMRVI